MKRDLNFETFHQIFYSRLKVVSAIKEALGSSNGALTRLEESYKEFGNEVSWLGPGIVEEQYKAFRFAVSIFVPLAKWKQAVRNSESDARRFFNSAKLISSEVDQSQPYSKNEKLGSFVELVTNISTVSDLDKPQEHLNRWSLPLPLFTNPLDADARGYKIPIAKKHAEESKNTETTVAFLKFEIDGQPARQWNYLKPATAYDLTIEVRVSNWPEEARFLRLSPVTVESRERDWLPRFDFEKPEHEGPYVFTATGRTVIEIAHSFGSRPYEFLYAAEFDKSKQFQKIVTVGHRRLLLEGSDVSSNPITGFTNVDRHLLSLRNQLRFSPGVNSDDVANAMTVLAGLGNVAAQSLRDGLFGARVPERDFQEKVTELLRSRNDIGELLHSHPESAGGKTDLTFKDIPIELKIEHDKVLYPKDFVKYFDQPAAYAIGLGKRIGILGVLESTEKSKPVGLVEDDIALFHHPSGQSSVLIVVVVIRGGFPTPSTYSR